GAGAPLIKGRHAPAGAAEACRSCRRRAGSYACTTGTAARPAAISVPSTRRGPNMMLEDLGNIGEFVGALGVVISLVYLARQMRQNTLSVRAASFNSMIQNSIRLLEHSFRDPEFSAFLARAEADPDTLTPEERLRWDSYMTAVYRHFGNLVYQFRVGALDEQMWEAYR